MKKNLLLFLIGFIISSGSVTAQNNLIELSGYVKDSKSNLPIPGVNVLIEGTTYGTSTNSEGYFSFKGKGQILSFSFVGYRTRRFLANKFANGSSVFIVERSLDLNEVVVLPGENPAWEIIRKARKNRSINDPLRYDSFSSDYYSKNKIYVEDTLKNRVHLVFLENLGRFYLKNGQKKEVISYSNQNLPKLLPLDLAFPNTINPIGFYKRYFRFNPTAIVDSPGQSVQERNYLSPLALGSFDAYDFEITDSTFMDNDTIYSINFYPKKLSTFDALEGNISISNKSYAITSLKANTTDSLLVNKIFIDQRYEKLGNKWVPASSEITVLYLLEERKDTTLVTFELLSAYSNPSFEINDNVTFDGATRSVSLKADTITLSEFEKIRPLQLTEVEKRIFDPENHLLKNKPALKNALESNTATTLSKLALQKGLVIGPIIGSVEQTYTNFHETARIGLALQNNLTTMPRFDTRGYVAYGIKDKELKYQAEANVLITKDRFNKLGIYHQKELVQPGSVRYMGANYLMENFPIFFFNEDGYRVDMFEKTGIQAYLKPAPFTWFRFFAENEVRNPINYSLFSEFATSTDRRNYGVQFRFANKEVLNRVGLVEYLVNTNYPIFSFNLMRSEERNNSASSFWSFTGELQQQIRWKKRGYDLFTLSGGWIDGDVPYTYLFNTLGGERETIFGPTTGFQTGDLSNFAANLYFNLNYTHYFGRTLFNYSWKYSQPEPYIRYNYAWGKLFNVENTEDIIDFSQGLQEIGLGLDALARIRLLGVYFSLGVYGSYNYSDLPIEGNRFRVRPTLRVDTF